MTKTQMIIDEMYKGDAYVILENISAETPILVLNAIMAGTRLGITDSTFIDGIESAEKSDIVLLGVPLRNVATAALHLLGKKKYNGDNAMVISMIASKFNM